MNIIAIIEVIIFFAIDNVGKYSFYNVILFVIVGFIFVISHELVHALNYPESIKSDKIIIG